MGIFDWKHWLVLLLVVLVLFGGKRLKSLGADLGDSIRGFRRSLATEPQAEQKGETPTAEARRAPALNTVRPEGAPGGSCPVRRQGAWRSLGGAQAE